MAKDGKFIININSEAFKRGITEVSRETLKAVKQAVKDTAFAAYASIASDAQRKLGDTRQAYMAGLKFATVAPDNYLIYLDGAWPNKIEDGYSSYDMKNQLLNSNAKVKEGPNAGKDWVKKGKKGQRYAAVPFEHNIKATQGASDLAGIIKNLKATGIATGMTQKITKVYKDASGSVLTGKVATFNSSPADIAQGLTIPNLEGLTKYQSVMTDKNGKQRVRSVYMTFRTISDLSPAGKWQHPGYSGLRAFQTAEEYVEKEIQNILNALLR